MELAVGYGAVQPDNIEAARGAVMFLFRRQSQVRRAFLVGSSQSGDSFPPAPSRFWDGGVGGV